MGYGIANKGDVLVDKLADGTDLHDIWKTIARALEIWNDERESVARLLSFPTVEAASAVPQRLNAFSFEPASEFGVPVGVSPIKDYEKLGNTLADWDLRTPFTWQYLRSADRRQVISVVDDILSADSKKVNGSVIKRILNPAPELNDFGQTAYPVWSGDGMIPLPHMGVTFDGTHSHYIASGATVIDSADIEDAINHIVHHGYGVSATSQILILANPLEGAAIQGWKAGVESRPSGPKAKYDFVKSPIAPAFLTQDHIVGRQAPGDYQGLPCQGSYGRAFLLETNYVPAGFVIVAASGGPDSPMNPVALRSHTDVSYQGLLQIPGNGKYPLQDSFFVRTFGVGTRHRSAAVAIQVTASPTYTAPADSQIFV